MNPEPASRMMNQGALKPRPPNPIFSAIWALWRRSIGKGNSYDFFGGGKLSLKRFARTLCSFSQAANLAHKRPSVDKIFTLLIHKMSRIVSICSLQSPPSYSPFLTNRAPEWGAPAQDHGQLRQLHFWHTGGFSSCVTEGKKKCP